MFKAGEVLGWNNTVHGTTDAKALQGKSYQVNRRNYSANHVLITVWLMDLHPFKCCSLDSYCVCQALHQAQTWHLLPKAGICQGAQSLLICFVTELDSHYFTSLRNLQPKWQESNVAHHWSGDPAPGVLRTLWTQNSSPFPSKIVHPSDKLVQGKASLWVSSLAAWHRWHLSSALTHGFINHGKKHILVSWSWGLQILILGTWNFFP